MVKSECLCVRGWRLYINKSKRRTPTKMSVKDPETPQLINSKDSQV